MRVVLRGSPLLAALLRRNGENGTPPLLRAGSAGNVYIGMAAASVKVRPRELSCQIENGVVTAIQVHSGRYRTDEGIGVGDSVIALANKYTIRWSEDHIADVDDLKMRFQIDHDRIVSILIW